MTEIALSTVTPIIYKLAKKALQSDTDHWYGLTYPVDYGTIRTERFKAFDYEDDLFSVTKVGEDRSRWILKAFDPETKYWDGVSNLKDRGTVTLDALFRASVFHDCGYSKVEAISKATGIPEEVLLAFFDDCFKILAEGYGASKKFTNPIYQCLRFGGSLYHKLRKALAFLLTVAALSAVPPGTMACYSVKTEMEGPPPDVSWVGPFFDFATNAIDRIEDAQNHFLTNSVPQNDKIIIPTNEDASTHVPGDSTTISETIPQPTVAETLKIVSFGRPDVSKATETPDAQISDLKMTRSGLTYKWKKGGCEVLGATSKTDYDHTVAVVGYSNDGKTFHCAKFDWISTSRTYRDFKNIDSDYNGWSAERFFNAPKRCFFIMSVDGKRRTNVLTTK